MTDRRVHYSAILLIFTLLWRDASTQFYNGLIVMSPRNVEVQAGLCVHIPCTFNIQPIYTPSRETRGIWLRGNAFPMKTVAVKSGNDSENRRERIFLTGDVWRGDCSLMINNARQQDADYYTFKLEEGALQHTFNNFRTFVRVTELSDKPEISPAGIIVAGQGVTLSCTSPGRCSGKPPLIKWEGKAKMKTEIIYAISNEDGTTTHSSNITFVPSIEDDGLLLTCTVIYENNVTTRNGILLSVKVCRSVGPGLIAGMVAGNIVILILIVVGTYCFLKRHMEKRLLVKGSGEQGAESTYQNLIGQKNDIYYSIRTQ
ncbi:sialic acid-binding Ig-like lectin 8 isoform X1 [Bufo bufo]|uniref:sialic acid-binding Ig-like lectin 8 isoform X1 n=2 Tax=Bufo bufo TaxID=8384 RepID=UPI001ABEB865|nr:sialic acid-binding Ig-like lectin 8 isoform X1 [Bufo bufo]